MIDKSFISKIEEMSEVKIIEDDRGRQYTTSEVYPLDGSKSSILTIRTLSGIAQLIDDLKGAISLQPVICINGPTDVSVYSTIGEWDNREKYANITPFVDEFKFSRYMDIEQFTIELMTKFEATAQRNDLIKFVSSIVTSEVTTNDDDGISQQVVKKSSIGSRVERVELQPIIELKPYRTFREIDQPVSSFLVRLKKDVDKLPVVSLYEADYSQWRYMAIDRIYEYLRTMLPDEIRIIR